MSGDRTRRIVALTVSMLLHGIWFIQAGGESGVKQPLAKAQQTSVTRLTFMPPQQEVVKQEKREKPVDKPEEKAKPVKKEVVQSEEQAKPPQQEQLASIPETAAEAPMLDEGVIEQERLRYLAEVMAHIERYKRYPRTARRRGITGELNVRFQLLADGSVDGLTVVGGSDLLIGAVRRSVEMALPLPQPPASLHCPLPCHFRMKFSLNEA